MTAGAGGKTAPVFFASRGELERLIAGDQFELGGPEGHHAAAVTRLRPGERADLVDGTGLRVATEVTEVLSTNGRAGSGLRLSVLASQQEPPAAVPITLVQALAKGERDLIGISTAVEVGVDVVVPWQAERSVVVWRGERAEKARAKWADTVRTAAKQARRAWVPPVLPVVATASLAGLARRAAEAGGAVWVLDGNGTTTIGAATLPTPVPAPFATPAPAPDQILFPGLPWLAGLFVVVGPEGGIAPAELNALAAAGAQAVRLGPHVMRTSTAGPIAIALAAERLGRWSAEPYRVE